MIDKDYLLKEIEKLSPVYVGTLQQIENKAEGYSDAIEDIKILLEGVDRNPN